MPAGKLDLKRFYALLDREGLDAIVAVTPENVLYLSDFPVGYTSANRLLYVVRNASPAFCVIPRHGEPKLVTTSAALELAQKHSWIKDIRVYATGTYIVRPGKPKFGTVASDGFDALQTISKELGSLKKVGVELAYSPYSFVERLRDSFEGMNVVDATPLLKEARMVKSKEEVRRFAEATRILCSAMRKIQDAMDVGTTELELDFILKSRMQKKGADSWHQTTIAAGPNNGANIYNQPSNEKLKKGHIIRVDVGCVYQGYCADLSRTYSVGKPSKEALKIYEPLEVAEGKMIESCRPGVKASDLHSLAVNYVREKLDRDYVRGNVGHGVGVELYDLPTLGEADHTKLAPGMTLSVEVPYHKFGLSGFNIEDSIVITSSGCKVLSDSLPRELIVV